VENGRHAICALHVLHAALKCHACDQAEKEMKIETQR
jgi:hypothetical protein